MSLKYFPERLTMRHVVIKVHAKGDPVPLFPEFQGKKVIHAEMTHFAILEGGMQSGKTSVMLLTPLNDNEFIQTELSAEMFNNLAIAVRSAAERFGQTLV
jgi:hypothetical protein